MQPYYHVIHFIIVLRLSTNSSDRSQTGSGIHTNMQTGSDMPGNPREVSVQRPMTYNCTDTLCWFMIVCLGKSSSLCRGQHAWMCDWRNLRMQLCFFQQEVSQKDPPDKKRSPLFWEREREREKDSQKLIMLRFTWYSGWTASLCHTIVRRSQDSSSIISVAKTMHRQTGCSFGHFQTCGLI